MIVIKKFSDNIRYSFEPKRLSFYVRNIVLRFYDIYERKIYRDRCIKLEFWKLQQDHL